MIYTHVLPNIFFHCSSIKNLNSFFIHILEKYIYIIDDEKDEISRTQQKIRTLTLRPYHKAFFTEVYIINISIYIINVSIKLSNFATTFRICQWSFQLASEKFVSRIQSC